MYDELLNNMEESIESTDGEFLPLWFTSPGGEFFVFKALREYIKEVKRKGTPVVTSLSNMWGSRSAGLSLYAMGDLRYATPESRWMLHTVSAIVDKTDTPSNKISLIEQGEQPSEDEVMKSIKEKSNDLFTMLAEDLGVSVEDIWSFLDKHGEGTNETDFGIEIAKEINLYTHLGIPNKVEILDNLNKK
tara:strand:- start:1817 stop:2383 length:567 start_codon:yes stop_codon:yes gene_type:complete